MCHFASDVMAADCGDRTCSLRQIPVIKGNHFVRPSVVLSWDISEWTTYSLWYSALFSRLSVSLFFVSNQRWNQMILRCENWAGNHLIDFDVSQLTDYRHWIILIRSNTCIWVEVWRIRRWNNSRKILQNCSVLEWNVVYSIYDPLWGGDVVVSIYFWVFLAAGSHKKRADGGRVSAQHRPCSLSVRILTKGDGSKNFYSLLGHVLFYIFVIISQRVMHGCWRKIQIKLI